MAQAFAETCTEGTSLLLAVDEGDPTAAEYGRAFAARIQVDMLHCPSKTMVEALNFAATLPQATDGASAIGFMGDDHRPRTVGWDKEYLDALRELGTGIVYGNDLYQGEKLPTQCAMSADIVRALGHMCPPGLRHMYVDNYWYDLGVDADCLVYLPDAVVEHLHPVAGKGEWDEGYRRVNDQQVYDADALAYGDYHTSGRFAADVAMVRELRAGA